MNRAYVSSIKKLRELTGVEDLSVDPSATIKAMDKNYIPTSTRVALAALRKIYPENKVFQEEMIKRKPMWQKIDENQEATPRQEAAYISWPNVLKFRDEYYDVMTPVQRLLMALYTYLPPVRADYTPVRIVDKKPRKLADGMNYLVRGKQPYFLFHAYKTHATYGDVTAKIPVKLRKEIDTYLGDTPGEYLFQDNGVPWTSARLAETFKKIFQKFHGLDFGITMMRHSYTTMYHKGTKPIKELKKVAGAMMHGPIQNMAYRFIKLED